MSNLTKKVFKTRKALRLNDEGITHWLALGVFVLLFAAIGYRVISATHAETPPTSTQASEASTLSHNNPPGVFSTADNIKNISAHKKAGSNDCYTYGSTNLPSQCYYWVYMEENGMTASGASANIAVENPTVGPKDYHSLSEMFLGNESNGIELGWEVEPSLYNDSLPHLFFDIWLDGPCQGDQSWEVNDCGFVSTSTQYQESSTLVVGSKGSFSVQFQNSNWVLSYNGTEIGYYPESVFSGNFSTLNQAETFGEIDSTSPATPQSQMGNGKSATSPQAATISNFTLTNATNLTPMYYEATDSSSGYHYGQVNTSCENNCSMAYGGPGYKVTLNPEINFGPPTFQGKTATASFIVDTPSDVYVPSLKLNWGDGATSTIQGSGLIQGGAPLQITYSENHTYSKAKTYKFTVSGTDNNGLTATSAEKVTIPK